MIAIQKNIMLMFLMVAIQKNRIYGYIDSDNYSFLNNVKDEVKSEGYNSMSFSKIIRLAVIELRKNNSYADIKQKLIQNEMI